MDGPYRLPFPYRTGCPDRSWQAASKCKQQSVMSYVTQGRHGLVLYQTHAFSPHGVFSFSNRLLCSSLGTEIFLLLENWPLPASTLRLHGKSTKFFKYMKYFLLSSSIRIHSFVKHSIWKPLGLTELLETKKFLTLWSDD
jgi:hypothetical protein